MPAGTFGPYVGVRPDATVAAWASDVSGKRHWFTRSLSESGKPLAETLMIADAATEVDLVAVRPLGGDKTRGFVLLTSSHTFSGERVDVIALGPGGELRGGPTPLAESLGDVVWVDAFPTESGALAMWAVRHDDRASIYGVGVGASGELTDEPGVLASDVRSWQIAPVFQGVAIGAVGAGKNRAERGPLRAVFVDTRGHVEKKSVIVNSGPTALPDMDVARVGDRLVFAWSDDRDLEPRLYSAVVDNDANVVKPPAPLGRRRLRSATRSAIVWLNAAANSSSSRPPCASTGTGSPVTTRRACSDRRTIGLANPRDRRIASSNAATSVTAPMTRIAESSRTRASRRGSRERVAKTLTDATCGKFIVPTRRSLDAFGFERDSVSPWLAPTRASAPSSRRAPKKPPLTGPLTCVQCASTAGGPLFNRTSA